MSDRGLGSFYTLSWRFSYSVQRYPVSLSYIHPAQPPSSHFIGFQTNIMSLYIQCKQSHFLTFSCLHPVSFCVPIDSRVTQQAFLLLLSHARQNWCRTWPLESYCSRFKSQLSYLLLSFNYHQSCYFVRLLDYKMGCQQHLPTGVLRTKGGEVMVVLSQCENFGREAGTGVWWATAAQAWGVILSPVVLHSHLPAFLQICYSPDHLRHYCGFQRRWLRLG